MRLAENNVILSLGRPAEIRFCICLRQFIFRRLRDRTLSPLGHQSSEEGASKTRDLRDKRAYVCPIDADRYSTEPKKAQPGYLIDFRIRHCHSSDCTERPGNPELAERV
jgi:hypothetical protein